MNLSRFTDFFKKNKIAILVLIAAFLIFSPDLALAKNGSVDDIYNFIIAILQFFILLFTTLAGLLTMIISWFLSPEWTTGGFFGINGYLKDVWILVSNVVYFVFAFILIWIAFMNILGKGDKWELKQALPKFIVGVLIVPFSWFFVQFVVSVTSILTVSVLTLPSDTFDNYTKNLTESKICSDYVLDLEQIGNKINSSSEANNDIYKCGKDGGGEPDLSVKDLLENNALGIMNVYTYGVMNLESIQDISFEDLNAGIKTGANLLAKSLFDIVFAVVYGIILITLAIALLVRGVWLWLYMMLSPIFGLLYFFDKKEGGGGFDHFNLKEFFALAMVPVYVASALSFGLLFLSVVSNGMGDSSKSDTNAIVGFNFDEGEDAKMSIGQEPSKVTLTIKGGGKGVTKDGANLVNGVFSSGKGMIGSLIIQIFGIVILWMAVMAAFKSSKITNTVTEPIQQFGTQVGQLMQKAPTYAPIFGGKSASELSSAGSTFKSTIEGHYSQKGANLGREFGQSFVGGDKVSMAIEDAFRGVSTTDGKEIKEALENTLPKVDFTKSNQVEKLVDSLKRVGFSDDIKVENLKGKNKTQIAQELLDKQNKILQSQGFTSFSSYRKILETNLSQENGVGDNKKIDRDRRYFEEFTADFEINNVAKVKQEKDKLGEGSIILNRGGDKVVEYRLKLDTGTEKSTFEQLSISDRKELLDFYKNLTESEKGNILEILKGLGLEKLANNNIELKGLLDDLIKKEENK